MSLTFGCNWSAAVYYIGLFVVLRAALRLLSFVSKYMPSSQPNFVKKYGKWAVVTGSTDGIGLAYADEFAKNGMNLVLLSRSEEKLQATSAELKKKYPAVEVQHLAVDFSKFKGDVVEKVKSLVSKLDVGVLVNNVGMSYPNPMFLAELPRDYLDNLLQINVCALSTMTHLILPIMENNKRGLIINIGSGAADVKEPLLAAYAASKAYVQTFSDILAVEEAAKGIEVQCHVPLLVTTKMSKVRRTSFFVASTQAYARAALNAVGKGTTVVPYLSHALQYSIALLLPRFVLNKMRMVDNLGLRKKALARADVAKKD
eukprot:GILJ01005006.1.p2 GENE.GILJ01005006.1~~GILJ01005006.1.p2  ORF type:complete len:315 (+),score=57.09 GILJ01005006.1:52-996(+)